MQDSNHLRCDYFTLLISVELTAYYSETIYGFVYSGYLVVNMCFPFQLRVHHDAQGFELGAMKILRIMIRQIAILPKIHSVDFTIRRIAVLPKICSIKFMIRRNLT